MASTRPLDGIRVLELGNFIAAPTAGRFLAEFGAEVIKVEHPGGGDQVRQWRLFGDGPSLMWRSIARNKKSVTLDLRRGEAVEVVLRLVRHCDVLLENFRPGKLEEWGLEPEKLRAQNPKLVIARISGFGQDGPYRGRVGFGGVAEAMGGIRAITGYPDRPPTRVGVSLGDTLAGLYATLGVLMALLSDARGSGVGGETVDVALTEAVLSIMESLVPEYSAYGVIRKRTGNRIDGIAPSNTYPCRSGEWVAIGGNSDGIFPRLMHAVGRDDLANDPSLQHNTGRVRRAHEIDEAIATWTAERTTQEVVDLLVAQDIPAGPIYDAAGILSDEQFRARGMFVEEKVRINDEVRPVTFIGVVPRLSLQPGAHLWAGPDLGAHTREVLTEVAGLSDEELAVLEAARVV